MKKIEEKLKYQFQNPELLKEALIHPSYRNEKRLDKDYQRLECLGDSFISLIVTEYLIRQNTSLTEGEITERRKQIVCQQGLAHRAREMRLSDYALVGKGEAGSKDRDKLLCDLMESIIGAAYLDGGYDVAKKIVDRIILSDPEHRFRDYKTELQNRLGSDVDYLEYREVSEYGPDHEKTYEMAVFFRKQQISTGSGRSKKSAMQAAAKEALKVLNL